MPDASWLTVADGPRPTRSRWVYVRRPADVTWLIASAPCRLTAAAAARSPGSADSCHRLTWLGAIGVNAEAAADPNIITVPQPPAAFAAWYAINCSPGAPATAMLVPWLVDTMRFGAVV